jgi:nucleoside-diphosphate-sugar epimerase
MPEPSRVLVTGGGGYIGSTLVPLLLARGFQVTVLDRSEDGGKALRACQFSPGFRLVQGDIRDGDAVLEAARDVEAIIHLAAVSGYPACARDPAEATDVNVRGTARVLEVAGGRMTVVLASSLSCYGAVPEGYCDETTPARPVSHYARTKLQAEALVLASPMGIALRLATAYGLSPRMRLDLLVNSFVYRLGQGELLEVYEPEARRAFLHVKDASRAFLFALEVAPRLAGRLFNVGDESQNQTKRALVERIRRRFPSTRVSYSTRGRDEDRRDYAVSFSRFHSEGFRVQVSLEQGLEELAWAFAPS